MWVNHQANNIFHFLEETEARKIEINEKAIKP